MLSSFLCVRLRGKVQQLLSTPSLNAQILIEVFVFQGVLIEEFHCRHGSSQKEGLRAENSNQSVYVYTFGNVCCSAESGVIAGGIPAWLGKCFIFCRLVVAHVPRLKVWPIFRRALKKERVLFLALHLFV